jgi:hypothetical protein
VPVPRFEQLHQLGVARPRQRVRNLVGRDDVEVRIDERRICIDDGGAGRAVDECAVRKLQLRDRPRERLRPHLVLGDIEQLAPAPQVDAVGVHGEPAAVCQANHADVESPREKILALLLKLLDDSAAHVANADDRERQPRPAFEKSLMDHVERADLLRRTYDARDVAFGGSLRNRTDIDVLPPERVEQLAGHTGAAFHPLAHHRDDRLVFPPVDAHLPVVHLGPELPVDRVQRAAAIDGPDGETDSVLGRGLRNQDDADILRSEASEQPLGYAGHPDHRGASQREQIDVADRCNPLRETSLIRYVVPGDERPRRVRIERVLDQDWDLPCHRGRNCGRVEYLCAEIRQLHCFFIGHSGERQR